MLWTKVALALEGLKRNAYSNASGHEGVDCLKELGL